MGKNTVSSNMIGFNGRLGEERKPGIKVNNTGGVYSEVQNNYDLEILSRLPKTHLRRIANPAMTLKPVNHFNCDRTKQIKVCIMI